MSEQAQLGPSTDGTVMLDIGGDIGALILHTGPDLLLAEIEISRVDGTAPLNDGHAHGETDGAQSVDAGHSHPHPHSHPHDDTGGHSHEPAHGGAPRTHVAVRERRGPSGIRYAAIYPGLRSGDYHVWSPAGQIADTVTIAGGAVAELDWR